MAEEHESFFPCAQEELDGLCRRDPRLAELIRAAGPLRRPVIPDIFQALVNSVTGQQISSRVHAKLWGRVREELSPLTPEHLAGLSPEDFRRCGLSARKAGYIQSLARDILEGRFVPEDLRSLDDNAVRERLCRLRGIGPWTAEMLLIFCLGRPDILPAGDYGIRRGLTLLYGEKELSPGFFEACRARWSPSSTLASLYLWELASGPVPGFEPAR